MTTIDALLRRLGEDASLATPAAEGSAEPSSIAVWETSDPPPLATDSVVFGVGVIEADAIFSAAARASCAGIVLREPRERAVRSTWVRQAREGGVALVLLRRSASWVSALQSASEAIAVPSADGGRTETASAETATHVPLGDVFALADAFADMVGGPVILEDATFRILAYSSFTGVTDQGRNTAILGRRMPPEWLAYLEHTGALARLRTTSEVVDLQSGPWHAHRRLITAVRTETQLLGIIWAAEGDQPLPASAADALREAAVIAVPYLLRHQEGHRYERRWRGQLVRSLLDGRGHLHRHADELGLPHTATFAVLGFAPAPNSADPTEEVWERITDHVAVSCEAFRWRAAVARVGGTVFAILAIPDGRSPDGAVRLGHDIVIRSVPVLSGELCGAISTVGPGLDTISFRRTETEDALGVVRSGHTERFVRYSDVQPQVIFRELGRILEQRPDLRLPGLQALTNEDSRRGREYLATLRTFLSTGGNSSEAAKRMGIHVTTLRYRLSRIKEMSRLALDDPAVRLVCEVLLTTGNQRRYGSGS